MMQATLRDTLHFEGVGLHTGEYAKVDVQPAQADHGLWFVLGETRIPAIAEYVLDTSRATVLGRDGASISTTEHLLSALFAMGVTNADVHVAGPEIPARDGSAAEFVAAILASGLETQTRPRRVLELEKPFVVRDGERMIAALPSPVFRVRFVADFHPPIGTQYFDAEIDRQEYLEEVASARTFAFLDEVEALRARGLGRGGSLENALIFAADGPIQPLRWPNEAVRHKVLDLIGDMALLGAWPHCEFVAIKSGHELHASITRDLRTRLGVASV
ncbi:MAG: UDP-3-O-acyl-N-acetylglucosamine deacetylase [Candidatus Cybelea sp.]|jgi:UDP-3-O-[3-hydroxymyristoyl] N-acetylglucosamine deacetylase